MSKINSIYVRLAEIYYYDEGLEEFKSRIQNLIEAGKSKEEAVLIVALEKGLWIPEIEELQKKGTSKEKAASKVAKTMKIEASAEEKVEKLEETVKLKETLPTPAPILTIKIISKYFIHGLAFSILFFILGIVMVFVLAILVSLGSIIGLIIGIGLLLFIMGALNAAITDLLWFKVSESLLSALFHGIFLFMMLLIVDGVFIWVPILTFPNLYVQIITFIVGTFLNGLVGKTVAGFWKET